MRNPKWHRDEVILALDLYFDKELGPIDAKNSRIVALSGILNKLPFSETGSIQETFRNPNGVALKLSNFKALDPSYSGKGMESYSKLDKEVFEEFSVDLPRLKSVANQIRNKVNNPAISNRIAKIQDGVSVQHESIIANAVENSSKNNAELNITIEQYQDAINNALTDKQKELLQILYAFPGSTATAKQLASVIGVNSKDPIVASGQIGRIGKAIAGYLNVTPTTYIDGREERLAFFRLVGPYYGPEVGWTMEQNLAIALEKLGLVVPAEDHPMSIAKLPNEEQFEDGVSFIEGNVVKVSVNRYERNQKARQQCIKHYGNSCFACGFNFGQTYGAIAEGFIHVHHKTALSEIGKEYEVDPIKDLVPLCANCHSVIHLTDPMMTAERLRGIIIEADVEK